MVTGSPSDDATEAGVGARAPAPAELHPGDRIGRYVIERELGRGSEGRVLAAHDPELDRPIAIKCLNADAREGWPRARMIREARALAQLDHPNVVKIFDVVETPSVLAFAMERIDGSDMRAWLAAAPRSIPDVVAVMIQAGQGLATAHAAGLVHRDFKPANVLIASSGRVVVTDFGLVREDPSRPPVGGSAHDPSFVTHPRVAVGTPRYMAPEQIIGGSVDARIDQFAFCVTLFEACFGRHPFVSGDASSGPAQALARRAKPVEFPPGAPGWLAAVIRRGLAGSADQRFATMDELLAALARPRRRMRMLVVIAGVALLAAGGAVIGGATPARERAATVEPGALGSGLRAQARLAAIGHFAAEINDGRYGQAGPPLEALALDAARDGDDRVAFAAAEVLINLYAMRTSRIEEAARWLAFGDAALARLPDVHADLNVRAAVMSAIVALHQRDYERARVAYETAVDLNPVDDWEREGQIRGNLAVVLATNGEFHAAREQLEWALESTRDRFVRASVQGNLCSVLVELGEHDRGIFCFEEAIDETRETVGADHPEVAARLVGLGIHYLNAGAADRAIEPLSHAIAIYARDERGGDASEPYASTALARAWLEVGNHAIARSLATEAIADIETSRNAFVEATARYVLARTLWRENRELALREAGLAVRLFEEEGDARTADEVVTWLAEHGGSD